MAKVTSAVEICNLALSHIGSKSALSIATPSTREEIVAAKWYDTTRRNLLRKLPWNFAKKRTSLARNSTDPEFGYEDAYDLPADFIRLLSIGELLVGEDIKTEYEIENNQILINNGGEALEIIYIFNQEVVSRFDSSFVTLLALELAKDMSFEITGKNTVSDRLTKDIAVATALAASIDGQERPPRRRQVSKFLSARRNVLYSGNNPQYVNF